MGRAILIHTFGGLLLGILLFTFGDEELTGIYPSLFLPLWGLFGAILLYESLRPYFPRLRWGHMIALCIIWGLTLLATFVFAPFVCGVPLTMLVLATVMPCRSLLRYLGVAICASIAFFIGVTQLLHPYMLFRDGAPGFAPLLWTGILGAAFGVGVHIAAHWLQRRAFGDDYRQSKTQRERYFLTDAELSSHGERV